MASNEGWIKVYRKIMDHPDYFAEPFTRIGAWMDLVLMANYAPGFVRIRGIRVEIEAGQVAISAYQLAERWQWSRGKVLRYLEELENAHRIILQKTNVCTLISVRNNYECQATDTTDDTEEYFAEYTAYSTPNESADGTTLINKEEERTIKNNNNTHTVGLVKGGSRGEIDAEAEDLVEWVKTEYPELASKRKPLTTQKARWLLDKHPIETLRKIIAQVADNKKTTEKDDVYLRIVTFLGFLRQNDPLAGKQYTYEEMCDEITQKRAIATAFKPIKDNAGKILYWLRDGGVQTS